ncbi:MAG: PAS domain-containing protein [Gammaproteobacteria bacterium]|nr:PAS domain-containing protein [Gammaproteobacteria bacterium]
MIGPVSDAALHGTPEDWRILRALALYRLLLVGLLLTLYQSGYAASFFADVRPRWFYGTCLLYALAALLLVVPLLYRMPRVDWQAHLHFATDVLATTSMVYASGGVPSGMGVLLLTPAVGCSLVLSPRMAVMQAAGATLALFGEELFRQLQDGIDASHFTQTGILGGMLFVTGVAANAVAQRARKSELLVERVGSDLASLSRLNESIVEHMQSGVLVVEGGRVRALNAAAQRLLQLGPNAAGERVGAVLPGLAATLEAWVENPAHEPGPLLAAPGAQEVIPRFTRLGYGASAPVLCLLDGADELRAQAQQMKLAALGRLSAGIAHEIRNPLSAISHAGQLLAESEVVAGEDRRLLDMIQRHCRRIDKIVRDVLNLSRRDGAAPSAIELKPWLEQAAAQYQEAYAGRPRTIELGEVPAGLRVRFDSSHLQQVLGNLWDNSFEHGARAGRATRVRVAAGRLDGGLPYVDVRDNGPGIPRDLRDRIFEPFFTTAHQGTGLGLYLARELCDYNQARLSYVPQSGGACFRLVFSEARDTT